MRVKLNSVPEGHHDNSPAFQRWGSGDEFSSPEGTAEIAAANSISPSAVPSGLGLQHAANPALKRWASIKCPSGTGTSRPVLNFRPALRHAVTEQSAFTMIEIAIALAVIAFALVAIIGVLPTGMNVQKDNREDTIINQDGPYWLEALRSGAKGLDQLTSSVERIGIVLADLSVTNSATYRTNYDDYNLPINKTGSNIVGLLSIPRGSPYIQGSQTSVVVRVEAQVRALTGSATEQGLANPNFAFSYLLVSEIVPFQYFAEDSTNFSKYNPNSLEWILRSNRWMEAFHLPANSHESRLTFRWPYLAEGRTGPGRQLFRSMIAGQLRPERVNVPGSPLYFFQPQNYVQQ